MPDQDINILKLTQKLTDFDKKNECYFINESLTIILFSIQRFITTCLILRYQYL